MSTVQRSLPVSRRRIWGVAARHRSAKRGRRRAAHRRTAGPTSGQRRGHLSLAGRALTIGTAEQGALNVAAFSTKGMDGQAPASGVMLSWQPPDSPLGLRSGLVVERETLLGSSSVGAFGRVSGSSAFAGVEGQARIGGWQPHAGAEISTVNAAACGGMLDGVSPFATNAFALRGKAADAGQYAVVLAGTAAQRRDRPRAAHGSRRPDQGRAGAAPLICSRSGA